jgi:hypothetical protein
MKCPHCNQEIPEGKEFCGFCGKPIQKKPAETKPPKPEGRKRVWLWVLIAVLLVALVVLGVIFVPHWLDQSSQPDTLGAQPTNTPPTIQMASTAAPTESTGPLSLPEEVWLTLSGVEVQHQEAPLSIDDDTMHNAARRDDFVRFASAGEPDWAGFEMPGFNEGEAVMIRFRFSEGAFFVIDFRTQEWDTPDTFQWGFVNERFVQLVDHGEYIDDREFQGNLQLEPDTWYHAMLAIDPQGYFMILLWDETCNAMAFERHEYDADWRDLDWMFHLWVGEGEVDISRMDRYSISGVRIGTAQNDWSGRWSMTGPRGDFQEFELTHEGGRLGGELSTGDIRWSVEGTVFAWSAEGGWGFDIMRGALWVRGGITTKFDVVWMQSYATDYIQGSGDDGLSAYCLKRSERADYPVGCYFYYYPRLSCIETHGADSEICGTYGEVKEAGLEQEAGFPEPPGG